MGKRRKSKRRVCISCANVPFITKHIRGSSSSRLSRLARVSSSTLTPIDFHPDLHSKLFRFSRFPAFRLTCSHSGDALLLLLILRVQMCKYGLDLFIYLQKTPENSFSNYFSSKTHPVLFHWFTYFLVEQVLFKQTTNSFV